MALDGLGRWLRQRQRQAREEQSRHAWRAQRVEDTHELGRLSDIELIATAPGLSPDRHQMEMTRRLKDAIEALTIETAAARRASDKAASRLLWATIVIAVLTLALVALTVVTILPGGK